MKYLKLFTFILVITALLWPGTAFARDLMDDKVIFGGTYTLPEGETLDGNLVVFGGAVTLELNSTVNGDVVLMGGTVDSMGTVNGSLVGIGGVLQLGESSVVNGDMVTIGAALQRAPGAQISGDVIQGLSFPFQFNFPSEMQFDNVQPPTFNVSSNPALDVVWFAFRMFIWAALAILLVIFFATQTDRVARAALDQPLITGGAGLLTALLAPLALIALTVTIILIPVAFVAIILLGIAWLLGWVALGLEVGRRIAKMMNQEWAPAISAGVGMLILYFVLAGFDQLVPCVGWLPRTLVGIWGLGAVIMTYFGTRDYTAPSDVIEAPQMVEVIDDEEPELIADAIADEVEDVDPLSEDALPEDGLASDEETPEEE
ncbi:MAG: hypothetical protein ISR58_08295 [Anaerolineales bacterium]|nr:hypothetical protein [Chloroflexota bacterium]MBL6981178.1 hypothetical protein [Anaerolineales bacterium]